MAFVLLRLRGSDQVIELGELTTLGRHPSNDVQILDRAFSKYQLSIERHDRGCLLCDLRSLNGTWLNGALISQDTWLTHGDIVKVGDTHMRFVDLPSLEISSLVLEPLSQGLEPIRPPDNLEAPMPDFGDISDIERDNVRLRRFHGASRWLLHGTKTPAPVDRFLKAVEMIVGTTWCSVRMYDSSGVLHESGKRGLEQYHSDSGTMEEHATKQRSGVMLVRPVGTGRVTRMVVPIYIRQSVLGVLWLEAAHGLGMLHDDLLCTLCDLFAVIVRANTDG
jgi:hypothetical protein